MEPRDFKDSIFEQLARVGAAFSSPKRVEIIELLAQGERTVESVAVATGMSVANTSQHLGILRSSGLVSSRREGLYAFYRISEDSVVMTFHALRSLAESRLAEVRQLAAAFFDEVDGAEPIGIEDLLLRVASDDVVVVDVRPRLEYEAGHLPGAVSIPLEELPARLGEIDGDRSVVAYCRGPYCVMSAEAVTQFRRAGVDAQRLIGGPLEWREVGLPIVAGPGSDPVAHADSRS